MVALGATGIGANEPSDPRQLCGSSASAHCPVARYVLMNAPPTPPSPRAVIDA